MKKSSCRTRSTLPEEDNSTLRSKYKTFAAEHDRVSLVKLDLADADAVEVCLGPLAQLPDAPDILINRVGWAPKTSPEGKLWTTRVMPVEPFSRVVAVNLTVRGFPVHRPFQSGHAGARTRAHHQCRFAGRADYLTGKIEVNGGLYVEP